MDIDRKYSSSPLYRPHPTEITLQDSTQHHAPVGPIEHQGKIHESVDAKRLHVSLHSHFQKKGLDQKKAATWSLFCMELYRFGQKNPQIQGAVKRLLTRENGKLAWDYSMDAKDLLDNSRKISAAIRYGAKSAAPLGLSTGRYVRYGLEGVYGITGVVLDHFAPYARKHGLELDEGGIALAVLCFGLAAAGAGPVVLSFGLVIDILATGISGYETGKAGLETYERFAHP